MSEVPRGLLSGPVRVMGDRPFSLKGYTGGTRSAARVAALNHDAHRTATRAAR